MWHYQIPWKICLMTFFLTFFKKLIDFLIENDSPPRKSVAIINQNDLVFWDGFKNHYQRVIIIGLDFRTTEILKGFKIGIFNSSCLATVTR